MTIPCPFILLDSRIRHPWITTALSIAGQMALKFIFANIIEARGRRKDTKFLYRLDCIPDNFA